MRARIEELLCLPGHLSLFQRARTRWQFRRIRRVREGCRSARQRSPPQALRRASTEGRRPAGKTGGRPQMVGFSGKECAFSPRRGAFPSWPFATQGQFGERKEYPVVVSHVRIAERLPGHPANPVGCGAANTQISHVPLKWCLSGTVGCVLPASGHHQWRSGPKISGPHM